MTSSGSGSSVKHESDLQRDLPDGLRQLQVQEFHDSYESHRYSPSASSTCTVVTPVPSTDTHSTWSGRVIFLFTALGFTTGFHSICLFPILCETNGGFAFVICTIFMYLVVGMPTLLLETGLGQLTKCSPAAAFPKLCPLLSGIGLSMCWSSVIVCITEACFMSWTVVYLYVSADCYLPWRLYHNYTGLSSAAHFFTDEVLGLRLGMNEFGEVKGSVVLGLALTWSIIILCLTSGIKHIGKLSFITTPLTLLLGLILFLRSCALWNDAVTESIRPDWTHLTQLTTWITSGCYVFHSMNLGLGSLMTIASHNKSNTFILRDVAVICLIHFIWGFVLWLVYELLKSEYSSTVSNVPVYTGGPWTLFVILAQGVASLPHGMVFAIITYSTAFFSGLSTLLGTSLTVITSLMDTYPRLLERRRLITVIICSVLFLLGVPLASQSGLYIYLFLAYYSAGWPLILNALCVSFVITWSYGHKKFITALAASTNIHLKESLVCHLRVFFTTILPVLQVVLLVCTLYYLDVPHNIFNPYSDFIKLHGWLVATLPIVFLPLGIVYKFLCFIRKYSFLQSLTMLLQPEEKWLNTTLRQDLFSSREKVGMTMPMILPDSKDCYCFVPNSDRNNNFSYHMNKNYNDNIIRNALHL